MKDTFFDRGKKKVDDTGPSKHSVTRPKPLDFVRLSSKSTPEHPLMLGGTPQEAKAYLDGLPPADRKAYNDYRACIARLSRKDDHNPTEIAQNLYPNGYEIYKIYHKKHKEKAKKSINQPGESSTINRSTQDSSKGT